MSDNEAVSLLSRGSKVRKGLVLGLSFALAFWWGFLCHRHQVFPYSVLWQFAGRGVERHVLVTGRAAPNLSRLQGLAYVDSQFDPNHDVSGVLHHDEGLSSAGLNLWGPLTQATATLMDMDGAVRHQWSGVETEQWGHVELLPDGGILVVMDDSRLARYDRASREVWSAESRFHHDLWVHGDRIWALDRSPEKVPLIHPDHEILVDYITVMDLAGNVVERIALLDSLLESDFEHVFPVISYQEFDTSKPLDILHANHVEVFDGSLSEMSSLFAAGNILVSFRNINCIVILDGKSHEVVWLWGPSNLTYQHHPTLLNTGTILVFNNGMRQSTILEVDPLSFRTVWHYTDGAFFSQTRGSNQRLPNGNTLITESDTGYVFEVTPAGRVVWEFANPVVDGEGQRAAIWRMTRFTRAELGFLDRATP